VTAPSHEQTPRQLLALLGKSASEDYLVLIKGKRERESFKEHPDQEIHLHVHMKFITVSLPELPRRGRRPIPGVPAYGLRRRRTAAEARPGRGVVRPDVEFSDVLQMLAGISRMPVSDPAQVKHVVRIALDGLRYRPQR
jgi:hypothetical protein